MKDIKGLIFDLDGVIVDTAKYHFLAWQKLARAIGGSLSEQQNKKLKGVSRMESLDKILLWNSIGLNEDQKQTLAARKNSWYQQMISDLTPEDALPGALEFIRVAKEQGYGIALGSSSKNAMTVLKALKAVSLFDAIIDGTQTTRFKPDPQVFQMGAEALDLAPSQIIVFEDAAMGVRAAISSGFYAVGIGAARDLPSAHFVIPGLEGQRTDLLVERLEKVTKTCQ